MLAWVWVCMVNSGIDGLVVDWAKADAAIRVDTIKEMINSKVTCLFMPCSLQKLAYLYD